MSKWKRLIARKKMEKILKELTPEQQKAIWQPPKHGEKGENEVSAYTVAIPNLAVPWENTEEEVKASQKLITYAESLDGYIGLYPMWPNGTLLLFKSEDQAKRGRNLIEGKGCQVGSNITEVYIDKMFVRGDK